MSFVTKKVVLEKKILLWNFWGRYGCIFVYGVGFSVV